MFLKSLKELSEVYTIKELLKSILAGFIILIFELVLIALLAGNVITIFYLNYVVIIEITAIVVFIATMYAVHITYEALLSYNQSLRKTVLYIKKIDIIVTPLLLAILTHLVYLFI